MKLKDKISLITLVAWVAMITLFYYGSHKIVLKNFVALENQTINKKINRAQSLLLQENNRVESISRDWSIWKKAHRFIDSGDKRAMMSLLSLSSFQSVDIDYALFLDANNKIVYSAGANSRRTALVGVPENLKSFLTRNNALIHQASIKSSSKGLISIDQGILLMAAHVLTDNNGIVKGYLVIGKYLTTDILDKINNHIDARVSIIPIHENIISKENSVILKQLSVSVNKMPMIKQNNNVYAYLFLNDVNGRHIAILKIESPRSIYQLGLNTFKYSNLIIFLYSFVIILVLWAVLQYLIAKRIEQISSQFTSNSKHGIFTKSTKSEKLSDEISSISALYQQATHDPLTGLANPGLLYQSFNYYSELPRDPAKKIVILYIDIDHFKRINYTLGYEIGDQILMIFAKRLTSILRENDLACRLGGDEFVIMLSDQQKDRVEMITNRIFKSINRPIIHNGHDIQISASIGVCIYPDDGNSIETLIKQADMALDYAKTHGRNHYQFYSVSLRKMVDESYQKEINLQYAIDEKQLCLYYQPIFDMKTKKINSLEALIRWNHPEYGLIGPEEIIPIAEKTELIHTIGRWIMNEACLQIKKWQDENLPVVPVAVNVSSVQIRESSLSEVINKALRLSSLDPHLLEIEITETGFIDINDMLLKDLDKIKSKGISLTIDDFGTGYSALGYLKKLPVSKLKIDHSFTRDIQTDPGDRAITLAIIAIAHQLNLKVTVEGIENEEQYNFMRFHQVDEVQGFYLSKPLTAEECEKLLKGK